ncbi:hypothetical protein M5G27_24555 [Pseudomonas shahriarae]|uniref:Apea-like HEPN domain-containing protein n=1 Tax=Pseudomonas shahriarae TaxID=2745512 RepID=A0A9X4HC45_9PSED|nr:hypothetical protein [Pseudomonas shahriarae]MDD1010650.1 hypothetical protein [Pseudomonas shahriarae]
MKSKLLPPRDNYSGNLLWNAEERKGKDALITGSLQAVSAMGYWASPFPEGDGVTFNCQGKSNTAEQILTDFRTAFPWLKIELSISGDANTELAELAPDAEIRCTIIVPLASIFIQESFAIGDYRFVCRLEFDESPYERLGDFDTEYLEFEALLSYPDLLRINRTQAQNDLVINKCLALAEHAMDVIRFQFSSFVRPEFTPNPAGQQEDGFYAIQIIPDGASHLKYFTLSGISRPMSMSNNWLGPEVDERISPGFGLLLEVLAGRSDELGISVKTALRGCRQSFYALGDESRFLNLVFTLDGLVHPGTWKGWKHRTYLAALISHGNMLQFAKILRRYDELYTDVRNKLVHGGKDFYQISYEPNQSCDDMYEYIKSVIQLIQLRGLSNVSELHEYARSVLRRPDISALCTEVISEICAQRGGGEFQRLLVDSELLVI